jgi:two-component system cell cycle response regulator
MSGKRGLVVDDSAVTRALLRRDLERAGMVVLEAGDGSEGAIVALREIPDAVVTDLEMTVMDGHQLARLLKNDPATAHVPVVILTSHDEAAARFWGLATGADAYVTKDDLEGVLVPTVRELLDAAPHHEGRADDPPAGAQDVLARVVRQLDANLLEATLVGSVLESGIEHATLEAASAAVLEMVARVLDAGLLAIAVSDERAVTLHFLLPPGGVADDHVEAATSELLEHLPAHAGRSLVVQVNGAEGAAGAAVELHQLATFPLPLRDATGCLAVWPRDWDSFAVLPQQLLAKVAPQVALVLDNARLAERLWELSTLDGLTRLLNHRAVLERLLEEMSRSERYDQPMSVILADVDRFKLVNDTYGHLVGDTVLREVAQRFRRGLRTVDVVGRYGGEEFLMVLPASSLDAACLAARRLCDALGDSPVVLADGSRIAVTASFGVACVTEPSVGRRVESLLAVADARLYEAKGAGRRCVRP